MPKMLSKVPAFIAPQLPALRPRPDVKAREGIEGKRLTYRISHKAKVH
jgi:hypothetical protein